jgi:hypothetical protein
VINDSQRAAALQAGRLVMVDELHRHFDFDDRAFFNPPEVEMNRLIIQRVILNRARDDRLVFALIAQGYDMRDELARAQRLSQFLLADRNRHRAAHAAIEHARHRIGLAHRARRAGSALLAHIHVQNDARHGGSPYLNAVGRAP